MILTCPSCSTRYVLDSAALGDGRKVRCVNCSHVWFQTVPEEVAALPPSGPVEKKPIPPGSNLPARPGRQARRGAAAEWAVLVVLIVGLAAIGYAGRNEVVHLWPPAVKLYDTLGIPLGDTGMAAADGMGGIVPAGLELRDLDFELTSVADGTVLFVRGAVANGSGEERAVPRLRIIMSDEQGAVMESWTFDVGIERLPPGEQAEFETSLRNPDPAIARLQIDVAPEG
ncbi:MAG: DUF3426 domain-containing protein [Inquilinaceae bacterium]